MAPTRPRRLAVGEGRGADRGRRLRILRPRGRRTTIRTYTDDADYGDSPQQYLDFCEEYGSSAKCTVSSLVGCVGWARDKRDSFLYPRAGTYQRFSVEAALPVGDLRYGKISYQHQHWIPIGARDYALMLNGEAGWAHGYGGRTLPLQELLRWWYRHRQGFRTELARSDDHPDRRFGDSGRQPQAGR